MRSLHAITPMEDLLKNIKTVCLMMLFACAAFASLASATVCDEWNVLEKEIRDGTIDRDSARKRIDELYGKLREYHEGEPGRVNHHFPLRGHGPDSIGGRGGNGYRPKGYDFYDGNRHGGHPAQDIFIRDPLRKGVDSRTGKPVEILAFENGIVTAVNDSWGSRDRVRGGIYVWTFNPASNRYCYYAHLAKTLVIPGDRVSAGSPIGFLGRTGKNAWQRRSPTHLHFMYLSHDDGAMRPVNPYTILLRSAR